VRYVHGTLIGAAQLDWLMLKTEKQHWPSDIMRNLAAGLQARFVCGLTLEPKPPSGLPKPGFFGVDGNIKLFK
jgi:hypothetical protein